MRYCRFCVWFLLSFFLSEGVAGQDVFLPAEGESSVAEKNLKLEHWFLRYDAETRFTEKVDLADSILDLCMDIGRYDEAAVYWQQKASMQEKAGSFREAYYTWKSLGQALQYGILSVREEDSLAMTASLHMVSDAMQAGMSQEGIEAAYAFLHRWPDASKAMLASVYSNLASLYMYSGRMEDAFYYHRQALSLLPLPVEEEVLVYRNLAGWFFASKQMDSSLFYLMKIRPLVVAFPDLNLDFYYNNLACIYSELGQKDLALHYFGLALAEVDKNAEKSFRKTRILVNMSNMSQGVGDVASAEAYLQEAIALSREIGYKEVECYAHEDYAALLYEEGKLQQAYRELHAAYHLRDSVWNREREEVVYNLRKDFELEKMQSDLKMAELANSQKKLSLTILSLVIFFLLIALSVLLYRLKRGKQESDEVIRDIQEENDFLAKGIETEKQRGADRSMSNAYKDEVLHQIQEETARLQETVRSLSKDEVERACARIARLAQSGSVENRWKQYLADFEATYPYFFVNLEQKVSGLTRSEKRLAAFLASGLNAKEIANLTGRTPRSIGTFIYRLRKKIGLGNEVKTSDYFEALREESVSGRK